MCNFSIFFIKSESTVFLTKVCNKKVKTKNSIMRDTGFKTQPVNISFNSQLILGLLLIRSSQEVHVGSCICV